MPPIIFECNSSESFESYFKKGKQIYRRYEFEEDGEIVKMAYYHKILSENYLVCGVNK